MCAQLQNSELCPRKTFTFHGSRVPWTTARELCVRYNGRLAEIDNDREQQEVARLARYYSPWIGLNDREREGVWRWSAGRRLGAFVRWAPGQPNNRRGIEDCVGMQSSSLLDATDCSNIRSFMCQTCNRSDL